MVSVLDVLNRGIVAMPEALESLPDAAVATRDDVDLVVARAFSSAHAIGIDAAIIGAIIGAQDPLARATALIAAKYAAMGGSGGVLGTTAGVVSACPDGFGYYRHFRHGSIFWHPTAGAHELHGPIRAKWAALGWERSVLGYPTGDQKPGTDNGRIGVYNTFQGGAIHWHPPGISGLLGGFDLEVTLVAREALGGAVGAGAGGVGSLSGAATAPVLAIREAVGVGAREATELGTALAFSSARTSGVTFSAVDTAALEVGDLIGRLSEIGDRTVITIPGDQATALGSAAGAFEVHGEIALHYRALGGSGSVLGYPTTDETSTPDRMGRYNHFQGGSIYWTPGTGAHEVHGLIGQFWRAGGAERNGAFGYPISDELIPDRRIGHRFPEKRKKVGLPPDVIKLPAEAVLSGFSAAVSNLPVGDVVMVSEAVTPRLSATRGASRRTSASLTAATAMTAVTAMTAATAVTGALRGEAAEIRPGLGTGLHIKPDLLAPRSPSSPAPTASLNRFGDFENGVLFWRRGATAARPLQPWGAAADGRAMKRTPAEVIALFDTLLRPALAGMNGATYLACTYAGTTGYSYDGASVHNRAHRLTATVQATQNAGSIFGASIQVPAFVSIDLRVEAAYDPNRRAVVVFLAGWGYAGPSNLTASPPLERQLHPRLDRLLYSRADLIEIPDTDGGDPIALLSAKTLSDGTVVVYIEPEDPLVVVGTLDHLGGMFSRLAVNP